METARQRVGVGASPQVLRAEGGSMAEVVIFASASMAQFYWVLFPHLFSGSHNKIKYKPMQSAPHAVTVLEQACVFFFKNKLFI